MPKLVNRPPKLRHHARDQGIVTLHGQDIYLGHWKKGTKAPRAVREAYARIVAEYLARDGAPPLPDKAEVTIEEVSAAYWVFAKRRYRKNGEATSEAGLIKYALSPLRQLYGSTPAADFGPLKLQALRDHIARTKKELARSTLNSTISRIKRMFRWAKNQEVVPGSVYDSIRDVEGLRKGENGMREPELIQPVPDSVVQQTLPYLGQVVADMVRFQRLTGCRPGEVCVIRPIDVDRSGDVWVYRPWTHKTEHHERDRVVLIGPKAQAVLRPYLLREAETFCFVPAEQRRKQFADQREQVKQPWRDRRRRGAHRGLNPHYTVNSYRVSIYRAVAKANKKRKSSDRLEEWAPNQLRHSAATEIRSKYGLEAVQAVLGHKNMVVSEVYAEKDLQAAKAVMLKLG